MKEKTMLKPNNLEEHNSLDELNKKSIINNPDYFIKSVESNNIEAFTENYEEQILRDETLENRFGTFKFQLNILIETAEQYKNPYIEEIKFLAYCIDKLFNSIKDGSKDLKDIFQDEEKKRFYELLKEYFTDSFVWKKIKIEEENPNFGKTIEIEEFQEITQEQIDKWLDMGDDSETEK